MLQGFFDYDNPVWRFMGRLGDIVVLNIIWLICCIPIFTIGASTTALYYCTLKIVKDEDYGNFKMFFKSFKLNFKQATIIWLILLAAGVVLSLDFYFFGLMLPAGSTMRFIFRAIVGAFLIIWLFETLYVFPVLSRFDNTTKKTMTNAIILAIRYLGSTVGIILSDVAFVAVVYLSFYYLPMVTMILILFGVAGVAWINSTRFDMLFDKIIPHDDDAPKDGEVRPILEDVSLAPEDEKTTTAEADDTTAEASDTTQDN